MTDNREELILLAGVLEGEGSFLASRPGTISAGSRAQARVQVKMVDEDVVARCARAMGVRLLGPRKQKAGAGRWADYWEAVAMSQKAEDVMRAVRPWMGARRSAAIDTVLAQDLSHHPR